METLFLSCVCYELSWYAYWNSKLSIFIPLVLTWCDDVGLLTLFCRWYVLIEYLDDVKDDIGSWPLRWWLILILWDFKIIGSRRLCKTTMKRLDSSLRWIQVTTLVTFDLSYLFVSSSRIWEHHNQYNLR